MSKRPLGRDEVLEAIETEATALGAATLHLSDGGFARATPCEPWSVKDLLAHLLIASSRVGGMLTGPPPDQADASALEYFRRDRYGAGLDQERVDQARERAAEFGSGRELLEATLAAAAEMVSLCQAEPDVRRVSTRWHDDMLLTEYLGTRVFELAVHGLDLANGLGRSAWMSGAALAVTTGILAPLVSVDQLGDLGWDDLEFVAKATGRLALTSAERWVAPQLLWPRVAGG